MIFKLVLKTKDNECKHPKNEFHRSKQKSLSHIQYSTVQFWLGDNPNIEIAQHNLLLHQNHTML